jgi:hypothetical protein
MSMPVTRERLQEARELLIRARDCSSEKSETAENATVLLAAVDAVLKLEPTREWTAARDCGCYVAGGPAFGVGRQPDIAKEAAYRAAERRVFSQVAPWLVSEVKR